MIYVQYEKATRLQALVTQLSPILTIDEDDFYNDFFHLETCDANGLDNWGVILGQSRSIAIEDTTDVTSFYTDTEAWTPKPKNFNRGVFYKKKESPVQNLTDAAYRQLLLFIYSGQTSNNSIGSMTKILNYYYQSLDVSKKVIVVENVVESMSIQYQFNFELQPYEISIFNISVGALPRPAAVSVTIIDNQIF